MMARTITRRGAMGRMAALGAGTMLPARGTAAGGPAALAVGAVPVELRVVGIVPGLVRISVLPVARGRAEMLPDQGTLAERTWLEARIRLRSVAGTRTVRAGGFDIALSRDPLALRITDSASGRLVQQLRWSPEGLAFAKGDAPLLGLGQGGPGFDRRGVFDRGKSGQGGYQLATHGARVPIQWLIGTGEGWAMFVHQPMGAFDLTGAEGRLVPATPGAALDLFIATAAEPAGLMQAYAEITGYPAMPPLWSFGYQQSHRTLGAPEEILAEAREFRARKLPCDTMIYLGTGFCPNGWNTDNGEFSWNRRVFPDPPAAIRGLQAEGFKVVLHVVVEGKRMTGRVSDPCTAPPLPSGRLPDGGWPPDRQVSCYWPYHKPLADLGIDGWWPDQGDGLDPPSRLARNRMYFEGQQLWRPGKRVFALHRNGFAGMQRFAAFLWSGDVQSRWETLANHVPIAINTALSGVPYWGTDIGGFVATDEYSGELYARWFQFAAFNPLFRSHGRDWRLHMPWGWTKGERGVPETAAWHPDPASLKDERIEPICRTYLELRYRLMPYLYSAVRESVARGMPILRALWLHYPEDGTAVARGDQYLFGRDLLVAPITAKGAASRSVYLPAGLWHDWWTGETVDGGREIARPVDLATMPLYVRAGAILPLDPVRQHVAEKVAEPTTLLIHPGADGRFTWYEDDGESFAYRDGGYSEIELGWTDATRTLTIAPRHGTPAPRSLLVRLAGPPSPPRTVAFTGGAMRVQL